MKMTLILYESKYGFTEMIAKNLSLILGPAKYYRTSEFKGDINCYETVIICTPVYSDNACSNIIEYVSNNSEWLKQKKVILVCTCLAENMVDQYLRPLNAILDNSVLLQYVIGGRLILDKLDYSDYDMLKHFCSKTGFDLKDYDMFDMHKLVELALAIKENKDICTKPIKRQMLIQYIEEFLSNHNTCTLATGHANNIRATPIEYIYKDNCFYFLSEGGEKFANILLNPNVSICIYDEYKSMSELGGIQIMGMAETVDVGCDEYITVLAYKGVKLNKIISMPVFLNLIKVNINKIEFLWSGFTKLGYDIKQIMGTP